MSKLLCAVQGDHVNLPPGCKHGVFHTTAIAHLEQKTAKNGTKLKHDKGISRTL